MGATLAAVTRQERGKNEARRLRRSGQVPGGLYGGESKEGQPISVDPKELLTILCVRRGQYVRAVQCQDRQCNRRIAITFVLIALMLELAS